MRSHERYLQFDNIEMGQKITARCNRCEKPFVGTPNTNERTDEVLMQMRAAYEAHQCSDKEEAV